MDKAKLKIETLKQFLNNIDVFPQLKEPMFSSINNILSDKQSVNDYKTIKQGLEIISNAGNRNIKQYEFISNQIISLLNDALLIKRFTENEKYRLKIEIVDEYVKRSKMYSYHGLTGIAYDSIVQALNFGVIPTRDYHITLDVNFWGKAINDFKIEFAKDILISLAAMSFYLSRILGFQYRENHKLFSETINWVNQGKEANIEDVEYMCLYAGLIVMNDHEENRKILTKLLKCQYEHEKNSTNKIGAILITETMASNFGVLIGEDPVIWSERGLAFKDEMPLEDQTSLELTVLLRNDKFYKEAIYECLHKYLDHLNTNCESLIVNYHQRMRMSECINRTLSVAVNKGEFDFAIKCAKLWRSYTGGNIKMETGDDNELFILACPTLFEDKMIYILCENGMTSYFEYDRSIILKEFISIKNEFEGTWTVISHDENPLAKPKRPIPLEGKSSGYENAISAFYAIEEIGKRLSHVSQDKKIKLLEVPWTNTPIVSNLSLKVDRSISFYVQETQKKSSKIKKALLWCNPDLTLSDASFEKEALEYILKENDIDYEVFTGNECSKELFIEKYSDDSFDLIWLMCHGSFNFDNPYESTLTISSEDDINIVELEYIAPERESKRLLVLNACQSGCSSIRYDSMGFSGLGPSLTNANQSVIGHLWLAQSFAASIIGAVLMYNLMIETETEYGAALNKAIQQVTKDKSDLLDVLKEATYNDSQIVKSLSERNVDLRRLMFWGSLVLFD
ncbi:CHAT domain-containing protein [Evansella sp. AB-rgal1]|uniref:CHAT domain-containing protein n=1 Tax=Evansella sp. AB-rgal1 TaxID=3242696 RepID=UPI00359DDD6E